MPIHVPVVSRPSDMWGKDITVQGGYYDEYGDFIMEWCNHEGYEGERVETSIVNPHATDIVWYEEVLFCDKANCQAYLRAGDDQWERP